MAGINEEARSTVIVDGQQAEQELQMLQKEADELRVKMDAAAKAGDNKAWKKYRTDLNATRRETKKLEVQTFSVDKVMKNLSGATYRDLSRAQQRLTRELKATTRNTEEWKKKAGNLNKINTELKKVRGQMSGVSTKSKSLVGTFKQFLTAIGVTAIVAGLGRLAKELFNVGKQMQGETRKHAIVLGDSLGYVDEQAEQLSKNMGVTNHQFKTMVTNTADLLVPLDFTRKKAAEMAVEAQSLAGALDEWTAGKFGVADASETLNKAMLGEMEQLKNYGIAILQDSEEFKNLVEQMVAAGAETKAQAKAMATLELITRKSKDAQAAYNMEGNKLLRFQKEAGRQWRKLKENMVEAFDVSIEKKLENQRVKVNELVMELTDSNTETERRVVLLDELKTINPKIVEGLEAEKIETEKLTTNLQAYNKEIVNRIILANLEDEEEKIAVKLAKEKQKIGDKQTDIYLLMKELRSDIALSTATAEEKQKQFVGWLEEEVRLQKEAGIEGDKRHHNRMGYTEDTRTAELKALDQVESALISINNNQTRLDKTTAKSGDFKERLKYMKEILGITKEIKTVVPPDGDDGKTTLDQLKEAYNQRILVIKEARVQEKITMEEYDAAMILEEIAYLEAQIALKQKAGESVSDLEIKLQDKFLEAQKGFHEKSLELEKEANEILEAEWEELVEDYDGIQEKLMKQFLARLKAKSEARDQDLADEQERVEKEKNLWKERIGMAQDYGTEMGAMIGQAAADSEMTMAQLGKNLLIMALKVLRDQAHIAIAKVTIGSLSSAESIATLGIAGVAKAALLSGLVEAAYQGFKGAIKGDYYDGGPTGSGGKYEPAGIVHKDEYVIPQEGTFNPGLQPVIGAIEYARSTGNLASLNLDGILGLIGSQGFAQGGGKDVPTQISNSQAVIQSDPELKNQIANNTQVLASLVHEISKGIKAKVVYNDIDDAQTEMTIIKGKTTIS